MKKTIIVLLSIILSISLNAQDFQISKQFTYGGTADEYSCTITECQQGGYFLSVNTMSDATGNKTTINFGLNDIWLVKADSEFNILWQKSYGGSGSDGIANIVED